MHYAPNETMRWNEKRKFHVGLSRPGSVHSWAQASGPGLRPVR